MRGFEKKVFGVRKGKISWLAYYIHYILVPRDSTGRCHGDGQKHQQIPSWILLRGGSIWSPLAWRYQLQRERWRDFWRDVGVTLSSSGLRLHGDT